MTEREQIIASASKRAFVDHNGRIMRVFNVLRSEYKALTTVWGAVEHEMEEDEFIESLDFLVLAGYIRLRTIREKKPVTELCDARWEQLEGRFAEKGKRLMEYDIRDNLVVV